jgi:hypothetical protein
MGVLREMGKTRLSLPALSRLDEPRDEVLAAVRELASGDFEVFGEITRNADGAIAYLARDLTAKRLVMLRLAQSRTVPGEYLLEVAKDLDASVPPPKDGCPRCGKPLRSWGRFCTNCGLDVWTAPPDAHGRSSEEMLSAVKQAVGERFEILGEMSRAQGGGAVYFARNRATGKIEALRLRPEQGQEYSIGLTNILQRAVDAPSQGPAKSPRRPK